MPKYTYECKAGHVTDRMFKISEMKQSIKCPECKKKASKVLTPTGIVMDESFTFDGKKKVL